MEGLLVIIFYVFIFYYIYKKSKEKKEKFQKDYYEKYLKNNINLNKSKITNALKAYSDSKISEDYKEDYKENYKENYKQNYKENYKENYREDYTKKVDCIHIDDTQNINQKNNYSKQKYIHQDDPIKYVGEPHITFENENNDDVIKYF